MAITANRKMLRHKYSWKASGGDDAKETRIDARLFNRDEGYEVIRMINRVTERLGYESKDDVRRVEELIKTDLPANVRGRKKVFDWLVKRLEAARGGTDG